MVHCSYLQNTPLTLKAENTSPSFETRGNLGFTKKSRGQLRWQVSHFARTSIAHSQKTQSSLSICFGRSRKQTFSRIVGICLCPGVKVESLKYCKRGRKQAPTNTPAKPLGPRTSRPFATVWEDRAAVLAPFPQKPAPGAAEEKHRVITRQ